MPPAPNYHTARLADCTHSHPVSYLFQNLGIRCRVKDRLNASPCLQPRGPELQNARMHSINSKAYAAAQEYTTSHTFVSIMHLSINALNAHALAQSNASQNVVMPLGARVTSYLRPQPRHTHPRGGVVPTAARPRAHILLQLSFKSTVQSRASI